MPGGGGLCLHTILPTARDPARMFVAVSAAGVYRTLDGGRTWAARNVGVRAEFLPDKYPEFGQCVHKVVQHPSAPRRLFLQNHWGLYRSDDIDRELAARSLVTFSADVVADDWYHASRRPGSSNAR